MGGRRKRMNCMGSVQEIAPDTDFFLFRLLTDRSLNETSSIFGNLAQVCSLTDFHCFVVLRDSGKLV